MTFPHFLHFMAKKLEFHPIPIFSCAIAHAFQVVPRRPNPDRLKFFWAIKYDLRNHSHLPAMIVPIVLRFSRKNLEFHLIPMFSCAIAHAFRVSRRPPDSIRLKIFWAIQYDIRNHRHRLTMIVPHFLHFSAKKQEFRPIPIFSCAIAHAFRVGQPPPPKL